MMVGSYIMFSIAACAASAALGVFLGQIEERMTSESCKGGPVKSWSETLMPADQVIPCPPCKPPRTVRENRYRQFYEDVKSAYYAPPLDVPPQDAEDRKETLELIREAIHKCKHSNQ